MKEVLTKFESYLLAEKRVSLNTYQAYLRDIKQYLNFLHEHKVSLKEVVSKTLKEYLSFLKKQDQKATSMARKISSLKVFYNWACDIYGWKNFTNELIAPKMDKKLPQFLTEKQIQELFEIAQQDLTEAGRRNVVMLCILYVAGLRITELTSLKISQIDFESSTIIVEGKGGKGRIVPIPDHATQLIKDYLNASHKKFIQRFGKTDCLFPIKYGKFIKPITRQAFWGILKNLCKKTSIKHAVSPHQLRHSLATHLLKNGADLRSLQLLLGHEHISTVQIYTHVETSFLRSIYDKKHPRS